MIEHILHYINRTGNSLWMAKLRMFFVHRLSGRNCFPEKWIFNLKKTLPATGLVRYSLCPPSGSHLRCAVWWNFNNVKKWAQFYYFFGRRTKRKSRIQLKCSWKFAVLIKRLTMDFVTSCVWWDEIVFIIWIKISHWNRAFDHRHGSYILLFIRLLRSFLRLFFTMIAFVFCN